MENGNEVITRRKEQNLIEKTENIQIDKTKSLDKKEIIIPKAHEPVVISEEIVKHKRDLMTRLRESQPGYVHFTDLAVHPSPERYELEDEDLAFLSRLFPKDLKTLPSNLQLANHPIISDFMKLIEHIDLTRDFMCAKVHLSSHRYNAEAVEKVVEHWRYKTAKTKYPLLRKFWKANIKKVEFGELDSLRVAFREREKERMRLRKIMKLTEHEILEKLEQLKDEMEIATIEANLVLQREHLKHYTLQLQWNKEELPFSLSSVRAEVLPRCQDVVQKADFLIREYNPVPVPVAPVPEPRPQPIEPQPLPIPVRPINNDMAFFISTLISELFCYGFELNDFKFENIKLLNEKIRKIKRTNNQNAGSSLERVLSFSSSPPVPPKPEPDGLVFCKLSSYANPIDVFIEKIPEERFAEPLSLGLNPQNLTQDFLIKRGLEMFMSGFSMFKLPLDAGQNPYVYCGNNSNRGSGQFVEGIKVSRFNRYLEGLPVEEDLAENLVAPYQSYVGEGVLAGLAKSQVDELKLETRFKTFLNNKRVK